MVSGDAVAVREILYSRPSASRRPCVYKTAPICGAKALHYSPYVSLGTHKAALGHIGDGALTQGVVRAGPVLSIKSSPGTH